MVGTSLGSSRLWFTVAEGIVTELYYPRIDIPQIKDLGFIVADDKGFWVELRRNRNYEVTLAKPGVPAVRIVHRHPRFTFTLRICPSQHRDVLLLSYELSGEADLRPYALIALRLGEDAAANRAFAEKHDGRPVLWGEQGPFGVAVVAVDSQGADGWRRCSVGCLEESDGWQDFARHGRMTWEYDSAGPGAVTMTGELPPEGTLALGFGTSRIAAATLAVSGIMQNFGSVWEAQSRAWDQWLAEREFPALPAPLRELLELSATVLKVHQDRTFCGATVASLSIPWGDESQSRGGYHLVWTRDLLETAGALLAMDAVEDARDVLRYLIATQQENGHWLQNQWLGGTPFWQGIQLDETAFPVLLAAALKQRGALDGIPVKDMVLRALRFIAREGPATGQDRWEEDAGINTFTLAVAIAALVEGSAFLDDPGREFALRLADSWNCHIEDWAYVEGSALARRLDVGGYYVRTAPTDALVHEGAMAERVMIKNRAIDPNLPAEEQVATDFLQLVRYGLRRPDDPCILNTLKVIDALLRTDTPAGPVWHRYNGDGYGEHEDGSGFDGTGSGRGWPLLTGERGHYALAAGADALPFLEAMAAMTGPGGLLPEQVWDSAPIPERHLEPGKPSGSAMPLVWAHSEFIKLCYSRARGYPVDRPTATWNRYRGARPDASFNLWGPRCRPRRLRAGADLTIALLSPARVHWGRDGWHEVAEAETLDTGLGVFAAELPTAALAAGTQVQFTFYWLGENRWEGRDYEVLLSDEAGGAT